MSKAVKTIAKVAATAAAVYYGGSFIAGAANLGGAAGAGSIMSQGAYNAGLNVGLASGTASIGGSGIGEAIQASSKILDSKVIQAGGLAMQGLSAAQQYVAAGAAQDANKKAEQDQAKIQEAEAQKARIQTVRESRILAGRQEATAASRGFSPTGTSSVVTGLGSLNTQTNVAMADIQGKAEAANRMGSTISEQYSAMNSAQGWQSFGNLGANIMKNSGSISSNLKSIFA